MKEEYRVVRTIFGLKRGWEGVRVDWRRQCKE
jgi:hypothetical protein